MQKPSPRAPELQALLTHLQAKTSPTRRLRLHAAASVAEIIAKIQRRDRLKK